MIARTLFLALIGAVTALDLATKSWALTLPAGGIEVLPVLNFSLGFNRGISFGLLSADSVEGYVVLIVFTLLVTVVFAWIGWRAQNSMEKAGYAAIVGGALGNLIDRVPDGAVTDFLDAHAGGWHFPTFNLADVAITAGVLLLLLSSLVGLRVQRA